MNARSSWSAKADPTAEDAKQKRSSGDADLPLDDLLEARFDDDGRLPQLGQGKGQHFEDHSEPRPPDLGAEELERAVQKLAHGLDAIERQSRIPPPRKPQDPAESEGRGDFVTYSLDRLEARLEALSNRLQQRAASAPPITHPQPIPAMADYHPLDDDLSDAAERRNYPAFAVEPTDDREAERAELRRLAEIERARVEAEEAAAEMRRRAEAVEARRQAEAEEARRRAEAEEAFRHAEAEEIRRRAEAEEARRRGEIDAAQRRAEAAAARRQAEVATAIQHQFDVMETRIEALQRHADQNQIEPIRNDLLELLQQMQGLGRDGRSIAGAVDKAHARLDEIDVKVNAARNMAGNRLGEVHDRLTGIAGRLDELEIEIPGFDAVRENQGAILERFDRMEGLVQHLASADELLDRVDGVKRQLQAVASQHEVARIEEQMLRLADRIDRLPEHLSNAVVLERVETQLQGLAAEALEARRQRSSAAAQLDQRIAELGGLVQDVGESGRTPDLTGLDEKLSDIGSRIEESRRVNGDSLARLEQRLAAATAMIEEQEKGVAAEILAVLTPRIDSLGEAIVSQDVSAARRDIGGLDRKLDQLAHSLSQQVEHLAPQMRPLETRLDLLQAQMEELANRARDSIVQLGPFAQKLQEISDRVNALGIQGAPTPLSQRLAAIEERIAGLASRGGDPRALQTQLDAIVSRLELLKGRSIDPARLNDLFDRVDVAIRALPEDRFDRLERKLDDNGVPMAQLERIERQIAERAYDPLTEERFDRLERRLSERDIGADLEEHFALLTKRLHNAAPADISDERFARLEEKLDGIGRAYMSAAYGSGGGEALTLDDLADLRSDIVTLRRELRSLPGLGAGDANLGEVLRGISARLDRIAAEPPLTATELEARLARLAPASSDPAQGRVALGHVEQSLKSIEERLVETRRPNPYHSPDDFDADLADRELEAVAGMARALSDDVSVLKGSAQAAERKTKDSLDAVQDTLEAVVKRMAFLERDIDNAAGEAAGEPHAYHRESEIAPAGAVAAEAEAPRTESRETPSGGLLSRFTSRQLLKRATGGRAESFSPDLDEPDEDYDLPLEPNTDAPLTSDLTGAPSSDTALMSGTRSRGKIAAAQNGDQDRETLRGRYSVPDDLDDDDFLASARRAAREAAAEAVAEDEIGPAARAARMVGRVRSRRLAVLACALAIAVAFAAFQIVRLQMQPGDAGIAARPQTTERAAAVTDPTPPRAEAVTAPETTQAMAPPRSPTPAASRAPAAKEENVAADAAEASAEAGASEVATVVPPKALPAGPALSVNAAPIPAAPPPAATEAAPAETAPAETESAALAPAELPSSGSAPDQSVPAALPASIGPSPLRQAALDGDPVAAFEVATRFAEGRSVAQDMSAAVAWYEQAGEAGMAPAQYRLGSIYEKGIGVPRDLARAQDWYRQAADAGNVKAMHNLAVLYAEGAGGEPDLEAAARLFRQAAEHGVRDSQFNLAILHARGLGVPQDLIEAYKWFAIAASSGDEESLKRRDIIAAALSEGDLRKAEAASADFQPLPLIAEVNEVMMPEGGWGEDATSVGTESGTTVSDNDLVALVQKLLAEKGFDPGPSDGLLGRQTIDAITAYQKEAGLPVTGRIDNGLVTALREQST
jgi:localization factor PodJL